MDLSLIQSSNKIKYGASSVACGMLASAGGVVGCVLIGTGVVSHAIPIVGIVMGVALIVFGSLMLIYTVKKNQKPLVGRAAEISIPLPNQKKMNNIDSLDRVSILPSYSLWQKMAMAMAAVAGIYALAKFGSGYFSMGSVPCTLGKILPGDDLKNSPVTSTTELVGSVGTIGISGLWINPDSTATTISPTDPDSIHSIDFLGQNLPSHLLSSLSRAHLPPRTDNSRTLTRFFTDFSSFQTIRPSGDFNEFEVARKLPEIDRKRYTFNATNKGKLPFHDLASGNSTGAVNKTPLTMISKKTEPISSKISLDSKGDESKTQMISEPAASLQLPSSSYMNLAMIAAVSVSTGLLTILGSSFGSIHHRASVDPSSQKAGGIAAIVFGVLRSLLSWRPLLASPPSLGSTVSAVTDLVTRQSAPSSPLGVALRILGSPEMHRRVLGFDVGFKRVLRSLLSRRLFSAASMQQGLLLLASPPSLGSTVSAVTDLVTRQSGPSSPVGPALRILGSPETHPRVLGFDFGFERVLTSPQPYEIGVYTIASF